MLRAPSWCLQLMGERQPGYTQEEKKQTKLDGGKCGENNASQDRIAFLNGMIGKACTKVTFEQNSEEDRELARLIRRREAFQAELTANVKALRQHSTWYTKDRKEANVV